MDSVKFEELDSELKQLYGVKIATIKLECEKCHTAWGLRIDDYNKFSDIPNKKFICYNCQ